MPSSRSLSCIFSALFFLPTFAASILDTFRRDRLIYPSDTSGINSILLRLAFEVADNQTLANTQWEIDTHLWLQSAAFPSVGHFHFHHGDKSSANEARSLSPNDPQTSSLLTILLPIVRAMPGVLNVIEDYQGELRLSDCPVSQVLKSTELGHQLPQGGLVDRQINLYCSIKGSLLHQVPQGSVDIVIVSGNDPGVALEWEDKLKVGGVVIGRGIMNDKAQTLKVVLARKFNELYVSPGGVFWWYRFA